MRTLAIMAVFGILPSAVWATSPGVDFDGSSRQTPKITSQLPLPPARGRAKVEIAAQSPSGAWVPAKPVRSADGSNHYEFPPGTVIQGTLSCRSSGPNPPTAPWSATAFFRNLPTFGGHMNHEYPVPNLATPSGDDLSNPVNTGSLAVNTDYTFDWVAPAFATRITEEITWSGSCSGTQTEVIDAKVSGLVSMPPGGAAKGYSLVGGNQWHPDNHNVTPQLEAQLQQIGLAWHKACANSAALPYNDMSLPWGGVFDLNGDWKSPHKSHMFGNNADVSKKWVRKGDRAKLLGIMCQYADVHSEGDAAGEVPHYHLTLRDSPHAEDYESDPHVEWIGCCSTPAPQGCIDLGAGHPETLPVQSDCP